MKNIEIVKNDYKIFIFTKILKTLFIFIIFIISSCTSQKFIINSEKISKIEIFYVENDLISVTNTLLFDSLEKIETTHTIDIKKCLIRGQAFSNIKKILSNRVCNRVIIESPYISLKNSINLDENYNFLKNYEIFIIADSIDGSNIPLLNAFKLLEKFPKSKILIPIIGDSFTFWIHKNSYLNFIYYNNNTIFKTRRVCFNSKIFQIFLDNKSLKTPPFNKYLNCFDNILISEKNFEESLFWRRFLKNYKIFIEIFEKKSRTDGVLFWVEKREQENHFKHTYYNNILDFLNKELYKYEPYLKKELLWQTSTK